MPEYDVPTEKVEFFVRNGYVVLEDVVSPGELARYLTITKDMLSGKIDCCTKRGDLGGHVDRVNTALENCVQITHPNSLTSLLDECEHFRKGRDICNQLFAGDQGP